METLRTIKKRIHQIKELVVQTAVLDHRDPDSIQLLAVSKGQTAEAIREAHAGGISQFGENYWQEAQGKMALLKDLDLHWHFIGAIQSNKAALLAQHFSWVQSLSTKKIAELLSRHRPEHLPPLNLCLQVNLDEESSKSGVKPQDLIPLAAYVTELPHLKLRGLMAIPQMRAGDDEALQYDSFLRLTKLLEDCNQSLGLTLDTLSMGMSDDFVPAIRAGSTMLRIGRAIFGERRVYT